MKRSITFVVVLLVLGLASISSAQTTEGQGKKVSVREVITQLAAEGYDVIVDIEPQATSSAQAVPQKPNATAPATNESFEAQLAKAYARKNNARGIDEANEATGELARLLEAQHLARLDMQQASNQFSGGISSYDMFYGMNGYGNYLHPGFLNAMRNYKVRGEFGLLGFTCAGKEGGSCKEAKLFVDGCEVSAVNELLKGPFKGKLPLPAGARHIVVRNGLRDDPWYYETTVSIQPRAVGQAVGGEKYTNIRVGSGLFDKEGVPSLPVCK